MPQSAILGPATWNIYFDEVVGLNMSEGVEIPTYADDTATLVSAKTKALSEDKAAIAMSRVANGIKDIEVHKTGLVILYGGYSLINFSVE